MAVGMMPHFAEEERRVACFLGLHSQALSLEDRHTGEAQHVHASLPVQLSAALHCQTQQPTRRKESKLQCLSMSDAALSAKQHQCCTKAYCEPTASKVPPSRGPGCCGDAYKLQPSAASDSTWRLAKWRGASGVVGSARALTLRAASTWMASGMKRNTTPLALLLSRGDVAKLYTASMDTLSTLLCLASRGFCSRICDHWSCTLCQLECAILDGLACQAIDGGEHVNHRCTLDAGKTAARYLDGTMSATLANAAIAMLCKSSRVHPSGTSRGARLVDQRLGICLLEEEQSQLPLLAVTLPSCTQRLAKLAC